MPIPYGAAHRHGPGCDCWISRMDAASKRPKLDGEHYDFSTANAILAQIEERDARRRVRAQLDAMIAPPRTDTPSRPTEAEAKERMRIEAATSWQRNK